MTARRTGLVAIGAGALLAMSATAHAKSGQMPLGALAAPPSGFVDMCQRIPAQCVVNRNPSPSQLEAVHRWAGETRWAIIFAKGPLSANRDATRDADEGTAATDLSSPTEAPATRRDREPERPVVVTLVAASLAMPGAMTSAMPGAMPGAMRDRGMPGSMSARPWNLVQGGRAAPAVRFVEADRQVAALPNPPRLDADWTPPRSVTDLGPQRLNEINRNINRAIRPSDDLRAFGRAENWAIPKGMGALGDCEDYVLAKRQALIDAGAPIESLSIAVVRTRRNELHTVLLVATAEGELVLDNLSPWIVSWQEAPYRWVKRQAPGSALTWVSVAA